MIKHICTILAAALTAVCARAAVPLRWTVETSRVQPVTFEAYHGETLSLEATLQSYGKPVADTLQDARIYWQTNGMGSAYWSAPASADGNVLRATWTPAMDTGANAVYGFIGVAGENYRASFQLRMRSSPGAAPNELELPRKHIDFAEIEVKNAPWASATIVNAVSAAADNARITATNALAKADAAQSSADAAITKRRDKLDLAVYEYGNASVTFPDGFSIVYGWLQQYKYTAPSGGETIEFYGPISSTSEPGVKFWVPYAYKDATDFDPRDQLVWYLSCSSKESSPSNLNFKTGPYYKIGQFDSGNPTLTLSLGEATGGAPTMTRPIVSTGDALAKVSQVDAATNSIEAAKTSAQEALAYASGVYNYMHADENAWFSGTNYVFGADAASRHKFVFEDGMDLGTVPCSMALIEKRDGVNQTVWDQRDWPSWYWAFKAEQMWSAINATNDEIRAGIDTRAPSAWAKRTAATGLVNPDESTTWIDTKTVTLSPGMAWETIVNVDGCGYWTIAGNGTTIGGFGTNAVLVIKDFEGHRVLSVKKGSSDLVPVDKSQNVDGGWLDSDGRICFSFLSDIQPIGEYSTYLEDGGCFVDESDESCPVESEWEKVGDKIYRVHFRLREGINSRSCFARFKHWKKGDTEIEFNGVQKISGGLIYNGVKIAPVIPAGVKVGDVISWKVVQ